jgi:hypothetical protein
VVISRLAARRRQPGVPADPDLPGFRVAVAAIFDD